MEVGPPVAQLGTLVGEERGSNGKTP